MATNSPIEWTDATWNPVTGCSKISPGCKNCYAERMANRLKAMGQNNYRNGFEVTWYRHEGNPVALVRIQQNDHSLTPAQLRRLEVKQGWIAIGGLSQEPSLTKDEKSALVPLGN